MPEGSVIKPDLEHFQVTFRLGTAKQSSYQSLCLANFVCTTAYVLLKRVIPYLDRHAH